MKILAITFFFTAVFLTKVGMGDVTPIAPTNKLLMMHRLYYLPFSLGFQQGSTPDEIIPVLARTGTVPNPTEFNNLSRIWSNTREEWFKNSLLLNTTLNVNQSSRISSRLASHRIALNRGPFDSLGVGEQIQIKTLLKDKPEGVKKTFTQVRFLKSFLDVNDEGRNALFIVGASWCQSSRTYRALLESYLKQFPLSNLTIHSIVVEDPKNQIFDSALLSMLFPNFSSYSHQTIPRFLFFENNPDEPVLYEEGDALSQLLDRYFSKHRGFMDASVPFLTPNKPRELLGGWSNK